MKRLIKKVKNRSLIFTLVSFIGLNDLVAQVQKVYFTDTNYVIRTMESPDQTEYYKKNRFENYPMYDFKDSLPDGIWEMYSKIGKKNI